MNKFLQNPRNKKILWYAGGIIFFLLLMDYAILPWYVSSPEIKVPKVIGLKDQDAINILKDANLDPIVSYDYTIIRII